MPVYLDWPCAQNGHQSNPESRITLYPEGKKKEREPKITWSRTIEKELQQQQQTFQLLTETVVSLLN